MFDKKTEEAVGYYVYCLVDPRDNKPFYIGKGKGNRVFAHAADDLMQPSDSDKLEKIREIKACGESVKHVIVRHGLDKVTAFAIETALIDFSDFFDLDLTNIMRGHKSSAFGLMTVEQIYRKYSAKPLEELGDGCVIVNINQEYKRAKGTKDYYDATKESWLISPKRIPELKYVLSEYGGYIVEVFEVDEGGWYQKQDSKGRTRWGFNGKQAPDKIRDQYLNRSINKPRGSANPVLYNLKKITKKRS
ncbi:MAG: hypothetical protein V6Z81_08580 [Parvularculales bacterium]